MKKISPALAFLFFVIAMNAQPLQKQNKTVLPFFDITQTDGTHVRVTDLQPGLPVMMVYFDPDCDHCEVFIKDLQKEIGSFKNVQIVMVTYVPLPALKKFVAKTSLKATTNLRIGTEGDTFVVRYHYNIMQFPFLALHDKNGNLFATYESLVPSAVELATMFK
jgi:peroxiredoxin